MAKVKKKKKTVSRKHKVARKPRPKPKKKVVRAKRRKVTVAKKRSPRKRSRKREVKRVQIITVQRTVGKKKRKKRRSTSRRRPVVMAGRRRSVGGKGGSGMLIAVGIGALAVYLLTRPKQPTYPNTGVLPPLSQTNNFQRNDQANSVLSYAMAAGLAADAIAKLIDRLNGSDDNGVKQIYDTVQTTGNVGVYV